ncbi:MFS sugar transporter-like protein [Rhizodiscina lignyota]|uniref:MFS sugar transporter-like protein n=1 Tax=Rhizodiscina lignyota TaxID=1504668 RepID=A0A9P4M088_9PEZI|nr:MFS sugar transporter-like protein [Rhizodiscina lignyota]
MKPHLLGNLRAYYLGSVVCMGGFLFGYDSGIVGGVLTLPSFLSDYHAPAAHSTRTNSLAVGLQQLGAFVACFFIWPITNILGRRKALMLSSVVFCIGALIQTINTGSLAAFYVARVIAGLGLGAASVVVPMFSSEMSPKELRGQIGSFFQLFYTLGIFTSYWIDYGVQQRIKGGEARQWQIPIGLQLLPAGFLGLGMITVKESVRWLMKKGREEEARKSLVWIRGGDTAEVEEEFMEIRTGLEIERRETEGFQIKELFEKDNFKRCNLAFWVFVAQQATGATAFAYFGPQYFKLLVGGGSKDLLLTAIFGAIKVAACGLFVLFLADRVDRRWVLIAGAAFMAACQITCAVVVKEKPSPGQGKVTSSGIATVALIYLFVIAYNFSWGPLPWPYVSEIFPTRIREPGIAIGVSSQWLFNFVFSLTTPYMITNMGWGTFLLWGLFDAVIAVFTFCFLKETRGRSLEEIAHDTVLKPKVVEHIEVENYAGGK